MVSEPVGSVWTLGLTAVEPTLFRVVGMDTSRPPYFDGTNFPYYKARMACHLEGVDLGVWRVTRDGMKLFTPKFRKKNAGREVPKVVSSRNRFYKDQYQLIQMQH